MEEIKKDTDYKVENTHDWYMGYLFGRKAMEEEMVRNFNRAMEKPMAKLSNTVDSLVVSADGLGETINQISKRIL